MSYAAAAATYFYPESLNGPGRGGLVGFESVKINYPPFNEREKFKSLLRFKLFALFLSSVLAPFFLLIPFFFVSQLFLNGIPLRLYVVVNCSWT